jgi:hypothetical protein
MGILGWFAKHLIIGFCWLILFSVVINERPVFHHLRMMAITNDTAELVGEKLGLAWDTISHKLASQINL